MTTLPPFVVHETDRTRAGGLLTWVEGSFGQ
jgi:hypothetical protein